MPQLHHPRTRDAALQRLKSLNRWLIAGSAALTGVFTAVAANAFPGHTVKSHNAAAGTRSAKGGASTGRQSGSARLRAPSQAPQSSEESGTGATESSPSTEGHSSETPAETEAPVETTEKPAEAEKAVETEKPVEAEKPVETEKPAETAPEAPVVSGGS